MSKLTNDVREYSLSHRNENELVVIPESHDTGFDEYLALKIEGVYESLSTRKRKEECHLELTYPRPGSKTMEYSYFFEIPMHFAKDRRFSGLLTIDVTNYISKYNAPEFDDLISYLKDDLDRVTTLFVVSTDSFQKAKGIAEKLKKEMDASLLSLTLPSKEMVLSYLRMNIKEGRVLDERKDEVMEKVSGKGFEVLPVIKKALKNKTEIAIGGTKRGRETSFGY